MDVLVAPTPPHFREHALVLARRSSPAYNRSLREKESTTASGLPDSAYWTEYDHYMIEREARAYRRAYVCSTVAKVFRQLRQSLMNFRPAKA